MTGLTKNQTTLLDAFRIQENIPWWIQYQELQNLSLRQKITRLVSDYTIKFFAYVLGVKISGRNVEAVGKRYDEYANAKEQALVLQTPKGLIVLTGCAHPGIDRIARNAQELLGEKIYLVLGGFHLCHSFKCTCVKMVKAIRELKVEKVAPCHCAGESAIKLFQREYGDNFIPIGTGIVIQI